jgi:hypothetical protein
LIKYIFSKLKKAYLQRERIELVGRLGIEESQLFYDRKKISEYNSKSKLNWYQQRDMVEREGRIQFNEKLVPCQRTRLQEIEYELKRLA